MKRFTRFYVYPLFGIIIISLIACNTGSSTSPGDTDDTIKWKRGAIISCGATDQKFGSVDFEMSCEPGVRADFNLGMALLHSFEYDESEKAFAKVVDASPACAMGYWGIAMSNFHSLWSPPTEDELRKGAKAIQLAKSIKGKTDRETAYINAIAAFFDGWEEKDHQSRTTNYMNAMETVYTSFPNDKEAAILYALSLDAAASPSDKTYSNQKHAAEILNKIYPGRPDHPGVVHYLIHTYDSPELAHLALTAARKYAAIAPSSAHALHMPSHIFIRLGLWDEAIQSNKQSVESAICYAVATKLKGHWDEELHGLDYLVYAKLQKGEFQSANATLGYLHTFKEVTPTNFKVAYAFASIPSRIALETKNWEYAAGMELYPSNLEWEKYPWQKAIFHFAKAMGFIHLGKIDEAKAQMMILESLQQKLLEQKNTYMVRQVNVQSKTCDAWLKFKTGDQANALLQMKAAANLEDSTGKHPVTPGEVRPARELLADMLLEMNRPAEALQTYEEVLTKTPNRLNALKGAALAASALQLTEKMQQFQQQVATITRQ